MSLAASGCGVTCGVKQFCVSSYWLPLTELLALDPLLLCRFLTPTPGLLDTLEMPYSRLYRPHLLLQPYTDIYHLNDSYIKLQCFLFEKSLTIENKEQLETNNTESSNSSQCLRTERPSLYGAMVLEAHEVPVFNCMIAAVSNWLFLAGFVILPGTFTSLSHAALLSKSQAGREV